MAKARQTRPGGARAAAAAKRRVGEGAPEADERDEAEGPADEDAVDPGDPVELEGLLPPLSDADGDGAGVRDDDEPERPTRSLARRGSTALMPLPRTERSLTRFDPLTQYMEEVRRYPLLTREEEHELAVRYAETGDVAAARRLITSNLRLVIKIAHEYRQAHRNLLDLVQEGNIGLMQAVRKYDPYRGVKLSSYAAWWIRAYILKFILNNSRMVKLGTTQAQRRLFFNLRKEKDKLEREGFVPEPKLLAERLDVTEEEVTEMDRRLGAGDLSLDAPIGNEDEGGGRSHLDLLEAAGDARPDAVAEQGEFRALLTKNLARFEKTLTGRELTIYQERLHADAPLTLQEIGERYGISRERARQLEKRLTDKLRKFLRDEMGEAVQVAMGLEE